MKHGFIKVAAAAPEIRVADPMFNADAVIRAMDEHARLGVKVLVFPELTLTGATCGDLFYQNTLLAGAAAALLTAMLASVSLCCGVLNLLLPTERPWSLYVIGAAVMLWIWFVLPMLARRIPIFFRLTADVAAVGVYVFLISIDLSGSAWFRGLALPILGWACVLVFLLSFLLRGGRRSRLSAIAMCIGTVGLMALGVEYCMDRFFRAAWQPTWSLVVVVICVGLIIPLRVVRRVPSLREEARRRFNM